MKNPRVYIATGFDNGGTAAALSSMLNDLGVITTYRWWEHPISMDLDPATRSKNAVADLEGVKEADLLVVLVHGEPETYRSRGLGTSTELGVALGIGIPVMLVSPTPKPGPFCIFHYHHPGIVARIAARPMEAVAALVLAAALAARDGETLSDLPFEWDEPTVYHPGMDQCISIVWHNPTKPM